jgi:hypothetical protein
MPLCHITYMWIGVCRRQVSMGHRRPYAIHPHILDHLSRSDDGSTVQLLYVQVIFDLLRRVSASWEGIGDGFRGESVAKTGLIAIRVLGCGFGGEACGSCGSHGLAARHCCRVDLMLSKAGQDEIEKGSLSRIERAACCDCDCGRQASRCKRFISSSPLCWSMQCTG